MKKYLYIFVCTCLVVLGCGNTTDNPVAPETYQDIPQEYSKTVQTVFDVMRQPYLKKQAVVHDTSLVLVNMGDYVKITWNTSLHNQTTLIRIYASNDDRENEALSLGTIYGGVPFEDYDAVNKAGQYAYIILDTATGAFVWKTIDVAESKEDFIKVFPDTQLAEAVQEQLIAQFGIARFRYISQLTMLNIQDRRIEDLTGIEHVENLRTLYADGNNFKDLRPLVSLKHTLSYVSISGNSELIDVKELAECTEIRFLKLLSPKVFDASMLNTFTNITRFWVYSGTKLPDLPPTVQLGITPRPRE